MVLSGDADKRVAEDPAQAGERIAHAGLAHIHACGRPRHAAFSQQDIKATQQMQVNLAIFDHATILGLNGRIGAALL